ncbi:MAG: radical SAM protein [Deltaproteobacteria bacterium]|nr:radical SAM protein [Deltaproteobacteria bacterium]
MGRVATLPSAALQLAGYTHGARAFVGPSTVQVDLTDACNQNCVVCWLHAPALSERNRARVKAEASLPWEVFTQLLTDLSAMGTQEIYFAGGGEPLVYKRAWDALAETVRRGFTASLHTNFSLVDDDGIARLLDIGVHHVTVSLWAGTKEAYAATHPGTKPDAFDAVTKRLAALNARKVDRPVTKLYHVLTSENVGDVAAMLALAEDLGCDAVEFAVADLVPGHTDPYGVAPDAAKRVLDLLEPLTDRAVWRTPRVFGLTEVIARLRAIASGRPADSDLVHRVPCFAGWTYARVMADGRVIPCLKAHRVPSGNLHTSRFGDIWKGAKQASFRKATRAVRKEGSFFGKIGNDESAACGCELGCDNLLENQRVAARLGSLTGLERAVLQGARRTPDWFERAVGRTD